MATKLVKNIVLCSVLLIAVVLLYGGCEKERKNDIKETENLHNVTTCDQCAAMECEACKDANYCMSKCGGCTDQCTDSPTNETNDDEEDEEDWDDSNETEEDEEHNETND